MARTKGAKDLKPRKRKKTKEPTKPMRVPISMIDKVKEFIKRKVRANVKKDI